MLTYCRYDWPTADEALLITDDCVTVTPMIGQFRHANTDYTAHTHQTVSWHDDCLPPSVSAVRRAEPPYRAISAALRERIRSGEWLPGEQIPSVRQIAEEYGVSIGTARRATAVLAEERLVVVTPSWGAFIPE